MADEKRRTSLEVRFIGLWDDVPGGAPNRISEKIQDLIFRRVWGLPQSPLVHNEATSERLKPIWGILSTFLSTYSQGEGI